MPESTLHAELPRATLVTKKHRRISVIWLIPILAAVVALGIAVQRILSEGPTITIILKAAQGIEAGKTFIKYKDVNIGQVTAVQLSDDYSKVKVTAKITKSAAGLIVEDAQFWVVAPRITLSGVSGLGTLLSGNYIGFGVGKSSRAQREFAGLDVPPAVADGQHGIQLTLKAAKLGSLGIGAPVYYRSLEAGEVTGYNLAADGQSIEVNLFVRAPYDKFVNAETRFWNVSGMNVSLGADGVQLHTESLVAIIAGGLAFDTPSFADGAGPPTGSTVFSLFDDQASAMKKPEANSQHFVLYFHESLRGLSVGAPVTLLGLPGGEVTDVGLDIDPKTQALRGRVEIVAYPDRLIGRLGEQQLAIGQTLAESNQERHAFFDHLVEQMGMRAQLQSGSLITGQLFVALDFFPDVKKAQIDWNLTKPEIPSIPSPLPNLEAKLGSILTKLDSVQYEAIGADLRKLLNSSDQVMQDIDQALIHFDKSITPEMKIAIEAFRKATLSANKMMQSTDAALLSPDAPVQQELRDAMQEITRTARALRVLTDYLERHPESLLRGKPEEKN
ncbi:MAG: mammalian cell entry protein [Gammaproteobacteria bacterium 28-57-27]|nr:MAG: mammalian cell entry protein [Gammaproteobacteria bacterium 28-57-27]